MWKYLLAKMKDGMFWLQLAAALITFTLFLVLVEADAAEYGWGSKGTQVRQIQEKLRQYGYMNPLPMGCTARTPMMRWCGFSARTD